MPKIGLIGQISVGKTTLVNTLLENYYGKTSKKQSSNGIVLYHNDDKIKTPDEINQEIESSEEEHTNIYMKMPLFDSKEITLIDIPGIDSLETLDDYRKVISTLDLVIFVTDCNNCFTSKLEKKLYQKVVEMIHSNWEKYQYTNLMVLFNKYDESEDEEVNENISHSLEFLEEFPINKSIFKISGIKMMVKRILEKNNYLIDNVIPNHIMKTIFKQFYGLKKANEILTQDNISKDDLGEIEFTNEENNFFTSLLNYTNEEFVSKLILDKFKHNLETRSFGIDDYSEVIEMIVYHKNLQKIYPEEFNQMIQTLFLDHLFSFDDEKLEDYEELFDFIFLNKYELPDFLSFNKTPEQVIKELIYDNHATYNVGNLIKYCRKYQITNIMQFIDTEDFNPLIKYQDDIQDLIPESEKERFSQYEDYNFIKEILDEEPSGLKVNFYLYPEKFVRVITNYINFASIDEFISATKITLRNSKRSGTFYGSIFECLGDDILEEYQGKSSRITVNKEKLHLYPDYIRIWLLENLKTEKAVLKTDKKDETFKTDEETFKMDEETFKTEEETLEELISNTEKKSNENKFSFFF